MIDVFKTMSCEWMDLEFQAALQTASSFNAQVHSIDHSAKQLILTTPDSRQFSVTLDPEHRGWLAIPLSNHHDDDIGSPLQSPPFFESFDALLFFASPSFQLRFSSLLSSKLSQLKSP